MEFISQKEFDAFINSLGNGTESAEINDFQNFFAHNDFSSSVLQQNQLPGSFADQKRDTISNHAYPQMAAIPTIPGHSVLASSLDFEMMQSQTAPVLTQVDSQNFIPAYPTTLGAFPTELFGNSDVSSPDQSLSDGQYAYSSSGPSSPDSTSVLSAAPSSPDVQYLSQKQNPAFTPMFGVPANYGIDDQRGYEISSPQMKHKPVVVKQERTDLMEELEARVGWSSSDGKDEKSRKKPRDASKESQQEKHKSAEKQRRSNMNELLDRLKQLLPNSHTAEVQKMTKLTILGETVDYVVKLQELCKDLIQENKQLKAQMEKNPLSVASSPGPVAIGRKVAPSNPPQAAAEDAGSKKRKIGLVAGVQQYVMDGSRAIFLSVFFLMVVFSPYADHSHLGMPDSFDATAQTRGVLGNDAHTVVPPAVASGFVAFSSLSLLSSFLFNFIKWGILVIAGFAFMVWGDRSISTKSPNFAKAKEEFEIAQFQVLSGHWGEVEEHCRSALELLDRDPPRSYFMALLLTTYQLWRHIMHRFVIGVYIERFVASVKGTEKEYSELVCDVSSILLKAWHRAPPNVEWLYICLDALNTARVMAPNKVLGLTASSTFRIRGNTGMAFRMWEIYIDWGLRSMKETLVDTSLEQKHLLYSAEGIKFVVQGELVQAKASLKKALDIAALFENERMGFFVYLKTLSMIACVLIFERRWAEALQLYKMLITAAEAKQHKSGVFWGVVGLCACLVKLKEFSKAKYVRKYYMANFRTYLGCSSVGSIDVTNIEILVGEGKYLKAVEQAEVLLKKLSRHDMMVHSLPGYLAFGEVVLDLWEESLSETSSLRAHSSKLARMSHEVCTFVYKIATANPVIQPRALIFKGRYYFILKNYPKAKYYWTSSLDTARKLGLKADEKAVAEMLSTHTQLEINDDSHKNCPQMAIEKLVSTLTQQ